jgi:hypothetical protein
LDFEEDLKPSPLPKQPRGLDDDTKRATVDRGIEEGAGMDEEERREATKEFFEDEEAGETPKAASGEEGEEGGDGDGGDGEGGDGAGAVDYGGDVDAAEQFVQQPDQAVLAMPFPRPADPLAVCLWLMRGNMDEEAHFIYCGSFDFKKSRGEIACLFSLSL